MKTPATRARSSARPVSFSTIEARITALRGVSIGEPIARRAHRSLSADCMPTCMRRTSSSRLSP
jgi:hypothetical protein